MIQALPPKPITLIEFPGVVRRRLLELAFHVALAVELTEDLRSIDDFTSGAVVSAIYSNLSELARLEREVDADTASVIHGIREMLQSNPAFNKEELKRVHEERGIENVKQFIRINLLSVLKLILLTLALSSS